MLLHTRIIAVDPENGTPLQGVRRARERLTMGLGWYDSLGNHVDRTRWAVRIVSLKDGE